MSSGEQAFIRGDFAVIGDEVLPITAWWDFDGEGCSPGEALYCTAGPDKNGLWVAINLSDDDSEIAIN